MPFGVTSSPSHDSTHHYQKLRKAVAFTVPAASTSSILMSPTEAIIASVCVDIIAVCTICCLFSAKPTDPEEAFRRQEEGMKNMEWNSSTQSIYCNLESFAVVECLILQ